jgi:hypothetical protein
MSSRKLEPSGFAELSAVRRFKSGGRCLSSVAVHERFEACDLFTAAKYDEGIPGPETVVRRGRRVELTVSGPDSEDYSPGPLSYAQLPDGMVDDGRVLGHPKLLEPKLDPLLAMGDDVQKIYDVGMSRERGDPAAADGVG